VEASDWPTPHVDHWALQAVTANQSVMFFHRYSHSAT